MASGLPLNATNVQCVNDGPVEALFANGGSAEDFCGDFAGYNKPTPAFQVVESVVSPQGSRS